MPDINKLECRIWDKLKEIKAEHHHIANTSISYQSNLSGQFEVYYLHSHFCGSFEKDRKANKIIRNEILNCAKENKFNFLATVPKEGEDYYDLVYQSPFDKDVKVYKNKLPRELSAVYIHIITKEKAKRMKNLLGKLY